MSEKQGQVYIFDFGDKIKVGFSTDVQKRLRTIELSSGIKAKQFYAVDANTKIEHIVHSWLENRLEGEFFAFPYEQAKNILDDVVQNKITELRTQKYIIKATKCQQNKKKLGLRYKIDVMSALKDAGYSTTRIRNEKLIGQSYLQQIRHGEIVSNACLDKLCELLKCQPGDIIEYVEDENK